MINKGSFKNFYPYQFDWGHITVEGYNAEGNEVVLVFNCDISSEINVANTIQYVVGRVCYGAINFPENTIIRIVFDIRGQEIIMSRSKKVKEQLLARIQEIGLANQIMIEFVR